MAGQVWAVSADGGYMYSDNLSEFLRMELLPTFRFRQFADPKDHSEFGYNNGDTFRWNVYTRVTDASTGPSRRIGETQKMPEGKFQVIQHSGTIYQFGFSVPFTKKLDDLSAHDVKSVIVKVLKEDAKESLDREVHLQFDATPLYVAPTSGTSTTAVTLTTNGATATTNDVALGAQHVKAIVRNVLKERNIPAYFDNGDYGCIARPGTYATLSDDLEELHIYVDKGFEYVLNGEKGRYDGVRFFEQTNIASESWTNGKSDAAYFFGGDTVHEAIVTPEEIRGKIPQNYGLDMGVAWYGMMGHKIVHDDAANARIVKWGTAA